MQNTHSAGAYRVVRQPINVVDGFLERDRVGILHGHVEEIDLVCEAWPRSKTQYGDMADTFATFRAAAVAKAFHGFEKGCGLSPTKL